MAEMELRETAPGEFLWQWTRERQPPDRRRAHAVVARRLRARTRTSCAAATAGLRGTLAIDGVGKRYSAAHGEGLLARRPEPRLHAHRARSRPCSSTARPTTSAAWARSRAPTRVLGVEHILSGFDHLLFVLALLFLVGFHRRLVLHDHRVHARAQPDAGAAARSAGSRCARRRSRRRSRCRSCWWPARRCTSATTLARRWPALVAFLFGLVHGLGFAGALKEIGLPQNHLPLALLTFNVGVEIGQLLVVGRRLRRVSRARSLAELVAGARPGALRDRRRRRLLVDRPDSLARNMMRLRSWTYSQTKTPRVRRGGVSTSLCVAGELRSRIVT